MAEKPPKRKKRPRRRSRTLSFASQVVHGGQTPDPATGAVIPPVYLTSTYRRPAPVSDSPYSYGRTINPTRSALERNLAVLEGGVSAHCFASGMSAISAVLDLLNAGDHVVASQHVYGGTYRLFEGLLGRRGVDFTWVDGSEIGSTPAIMRVEITTPGSTVTAPAMISRCWSPPPPTSPTILTVPVVVMISESRSPVPSPVRLSMMTSSLPKSMASVSTATSPIPVGATTTGSGSSGVASPSIVTVGS